jgi:hypothetical protein
MSGMGVGDRRYIPSKDGGDSSKSPTIDSIQNFVKGCSRNKQFSSGDFSKLENQLKYFMKSKNNLVSEKEKLIQLRDMVWSNIPDSKVTLKREFLDATIRVFHPQYRTNGRAIDLKTNLITVFGDDLFPSSTVDPKKKDDQQTIATALGDAFSGSKGGTTLSEYSQEITAIQNDAITRFDTDSTPYLPNGYSESMLNLREELSGLSSYSDDAQKEPLNKCKDKLKKTIANLKDGAVLDLPLGMHGSNVSHALNLKLVVVDDKVWAVIDNFGPTKKDVAKKLPKSESGDGKYHSEMVQLDFAFDEKDKHLESFVDQVTTMIVNSKDLKEHQKDFYNMIDNVTKKGADSEKPLLLTLIEQKTHKEMSRPNCVRKTHNAMLNSQIMDIAMDLLGSREIKDPKLVYSFSKLMFRLYKQHFQDRPLFERAYKYSDKTAQRKLEDRLYKRHDKIIKDIENLSEQFKDKGFDFNSIVDSVSFDPDFKTWIDLLKFEQHMSNPVPDLSLITPDEFHDFSLFKPLEISSSAVRDVGARFRPRTFGKGNPYL